MRFDYKRKCCYLEYQSILYTHTHTRVFTETSYKPLVLSPASVVTITFFLEFHTSKHFLQD